MITVQKARQYANLLHPAFAGYYHDGIIHESDALAAVFHLIKQGYIEPEFKNHDITQGISHLRAKAREPHHRFEQNIVRVIFYESNRVTTRYVGDLIKHHAIQAIIASAATLNANTIIPPQVNRLTEHRRIYTVHKDKRRLINVVTYARKPFLVVSLISSLQGIRYYLETENTGYIVFFGLVAVASLLLFYIDRWPGKILSSQVIVDHYTQYYSELYEFLKAHPPQAHTFTYEFIPYAIAFNLDTSWHADFTLSPHHQPHPKHRATG